MTTVTFVVKRSYFPGRLVNKLMRAADLGCEVRRGMVTEHFAVTWKDGEIVDDKRKELAKNTIRKALEKLNYEVFSIIEAAEKG